MSKNYKIIGGIVGLLLILATVFLISKFEDTIVWRHFLGWVFGFEQTSQSQVHSTSSQLNKRPQLPQKEEPEMVEILKTPDLQWNLYRNFKYGFQIQYPSNWKDPVIYRDPEENNRVSITFLGPDSGISTGWFQLELMYPVDVNSFIDSITQNGKSKTNIVSGPKIYGSKKVYKIDKLVTYFGDPTYSYLILTDHGNYHLWNGHKEIDYIFQHALDTLEIF